MKKLKYIALSACLLAATFFVHQQRVLAQAGPIKIGVLHSLSGTMAI